jgi:hypothetical protein
LYTAWFFLFLNTDIVGSINTRNICLILSTIYSFISGVFRQYYAPSEQNILNFKRIIFNRGTAFIRHVSAFTYNIFINIQYFYCVDSFQGSTFCLFAMVQPWNIGVCWSDQVFVTELTVVIFFCSCNHFEYILVPKRLKHGRQNITLHWIKGTIRNIKYIFTKLNAVFYNINISHDKTTGLRNSLKNLNVNYM